MPERREESGKPEPIGKVYYLREDKIHLKVMNKRIVCIVAAGLLTAGAVLADVRLPEIIGSNMVLQRNTACTIWGWAGQGEKVTLTFREFTSSVVPGTDGKWQVKLPPMKEGGPFTMKIAGRNMVVLDNIMIGDVWLCSGQSNMEFSVSRTMNAEEEIASADYPGIRLFQVPHNLQFKETDTFGSGAWTPCNSATVRDFSAVGYFFGRKLHRETGVPIGLINSSWGGTVVETWISGESMRNVEEFRDRVESLKNNGWEGELARRKAELQEMIDKYGADEPGLIEGKAVWAEPGLDESEWGDMDLPGLWESKGLAGLDGVVWFRRKVDLDEATAKAGITLELGLIDDSDMSWVNGHKIGETRNAYNRKRTYKVPPEYLVTGKNVIAVRVEDTGGGGGIWGDPENLKMIAGKQSVSLAGPWKFRVSPVTLNMDIGSFISPNSNPTLLYNGMIHPMIEFSIRGVIWYQGESNADRAYQYRKLFPLLIKDWRKQWNQPAMPFLFVQLANYTPAREQPGESDWAELREAQTMALSLPRTGMAVTIDIGNANDIHPTDKQDVGKRLALAALHISYDRDLVWSGPMFRSMQIEGSRVVLEFNHTGSGLVAHDRYDYLRGFAMAGADRKFYWAKGSIMNGKVVLSSDKVPDPVAVRYAWATNPDDANLYNKEGLPASPFRTDDWPGITYGKK